MMIKRLGALVVATAAAGALAMPATGQAGTVGDTCEALLGSESGSLNLVVANVNYDTCKEAQAPGCTDDATPVTVDLAPLLHARLTICD